MYKDHEIDSPLSESSVSLKLSLIQKRCSELMDGSDGLEPTQNTTGMRIGTTARASFISMAMACYSDFAGCSRPVRKSFNMTQSPMKLHSGY